MEQEQFDWRIAQPYLWLAALNVVGLGFAVWRLVTGPTAEIGTVIVSSLWVIYNLLIIGAAVAVAAEVRQVRRAHRVQMRLPAGLMLASGHAYPCTLVDYSDGGIGLQVQPGLELKPGSRYACCSTAASASSPSRRASPVPLGNTWAWCSATSPCSSVSTWSTAPLPAPMPGLAGTSSTRSSARCAA